MACRLIDPKPLSEPLLEYCNSSTRNKSQWNLKRNRTFSFKKIHLKISSGKCRPFSLGLNVLMGMNSAAQNGVISNIKPESWASQINLLFRTLNSQNSVSSKSEITFIQDTICLILTDKLWGACCEYLFFNETCYLHNGSQWHYCRYQPYTIAPVSVTVYSAVCTIKSLM